MSATIPIEPGDLTAKSRVRQAALELFAEAGFDATSVRRIAERAGVSPGLVIHHFGSKEGVRAAVDEAVIARFETALDTVPRDGPAETIGRVTGEAFGSVIGSSPTLRAYLRRAILEDGATSQCVIDGLVSALRNGVDRLAEQGALRPAVVTRWLPYQVIFNSLGSLVFEHALARGLDTDPYDPAVLAERQAANLELLTNGMLADRR